MSYYNNKVIIITGAWSEIGAQAAKDFNKLGSKVVLVGRNVENLNKVASECEKVENTLVVQADVRNEDYAERIVSSTIEKFGQIDVLVNNPGMVEPGTIQTTSVERYHRAMKKCMMTMFDLSTLANPFLIKTRGAILNVSNFNGIPLFRTVIHFDYEAIIRCLYPMGLGYRR